MDKFIISLHEEELEELAWFQLSDKWEFCPQFQLHLASKSHGETTPKKGRLLCKKWTKCVQTWRLTSRAIRWSAKLLPVQLHQIRCLVTSVALFDLMVSSPKRRTYRLARRIEKQRVSCTMPFFRRVSTKEEIMRSSCGSKKGALSYSSQPSVQFTSKNQMLNLLKVKACQTLASSRA